MGFLLGAFGKQAAGTRYRSLQAKLLHVSSQVRRVHRQQEHMQKSIDNEKKAVLNAIKFQTQQSTLLAGDSLLKIMQGVAGELSTNPDYQKAQVEFQQAQAHAQQQQAQQQQYWENYYEQMKEDLVEPLKDQEEELTTEKEYLETQVALAKEDYEACKKMEQSDIKMLTPNYTGAQG